jgi:hypothetical protein
MNLEGLLSINYWEVSINVILSIFIALIIAAFLDSLKKPRLTLTIANAKDAEYRNHPATHSRFLAVNLNNKRRPKWAFWVSRLAATQCRGRISFHHLDDGQDIFGRKMPIRWSGTDEPAYPEILHQGEVWGKIFDPRRLTLVKTEDVYPGSHRRLDVAAKFDNDIECYGWSNESYFSKPIWRNPRWRLPKGRYLVKVSVMTSGESVEQMFRLINDVPRKDFRLIPAQRDDKVDE